MPHRASLPFLLRRSEDEFGPASMTSITETVHGLLRLDEDRLIMQWRVGRKTEHLGAGMRTDKEVEDVRELVVPLEGVAGAAVRRRWWDWLVGPRIVVTASDLTTFEQIAGKGGLRLDHPAELVLRIRRRDRLAAEEFSAELAMAVAEYSMRLSDERRRLAAEETSQRALADGTERGR